MQRPPLSIPSCAALPQGLIDPLQTMDFYFFSAWPPAKSQLKGAVEHFTKSLCAHQRLVWLIVNIVEQNQPDKPVGKQYSGIKLFKVSTCIG